MKPLIFLTLIIFFYSLVCCEVDFELLEEAFTNCTDEFDIKPDMQEMIKTYNFSRSDDAIQCYWMCFMQTAGVMADGHLVKNKMYEFLESQIVYGLYDQDDVERLLEFCETAVVTKGESECEMSYELSKCIYLNLIGEKKIIGNIK